MRFGSIGMTATAPAFIPSITCEQSAPAKNASGRRGQSYGAARRLQQPEVYFYLCLSSYRTATLHPGPEAPFHDGFDRFLIQSEAERPDDVDVARQAVGIDHNR